MNPQRRATQVWAQLAGEKLCYLDAYARDQIVGHIAQAIEEAAQEAVYYAVQRELSRAADLAHEYAYASRQLLLVPDLPERAVAYYQGGFRASAGLVKELVEQRRQHFRARQTPSPATPNDV